MENSDFNTESPASIRLNEEAIRSLTETRKWTTFFGIMGIIGSVFLIIAGAFATFVLPIMNEGDYPGFPPTFLGLIYLVFSGLYILPVIFLMRFSSMLRKALSGSDENLLSIAIRNLTLHFRTVGIYTIVFISLYILIIIAMVVFGIGMFAGNLSVV